MMRTVASRGIAHRGAVALLLVVVGAMTLAACGDSGNGDPTVLRAGQLDIKLPPGFKVESGKVVTPPGLASEAAAKKSTTQTTTGGQKSATGTTNPADAIKPKTVDTTGTTIPLNNKEDPSTAMFDALSKFRACLNQLGVKFIGAPDQSNPQAPTNDPTYIKNLTTCAARSNIVQAMKAQQAANDNLTPDQIKQRNQGYLTWRKCMIGRGWSVPEPVPDAQGRLFSFNTSGSGPQIQPPPGKDILSSKDVSDCAAKAQKVVGKS